jgi:hypothetical protein
MKPVVVEKFADNGDHSHWSVIDTETGKVLIEDINAAPNAELLAALEAKIDRYKSWAATLEESIDNIRAAMELESTHYLVLPDQVAEVVAAKKELTAALKRETDRAKWYERRVDLLLKNQNMFRDPERTILCDVCANGQLLPDPEGKRYGKAACPIYAACYDRYVAGDGICVATCKERQATDGGEEG